MAKQTLQQRLVAGRQAQHRHVVGQPTARIVRRQRLRKQRAKVAIAGAGFDDVQVAGQ